MAAVHVHKHFDGDHLCLAGLARSRDEWWLYRDEPATLNGITYPDTYEAL